MSVFSGKCQWQLDWFLICIPKASGLSGNHISQAVWWGLFLILAINASSSYFLKLKELPFERQRIAKFWNQKGDKEKGLWGQRGFGDQEWDVGQTQVWQLLALWGTWVTPMEEFILKEHAVGETYLGHFKHSAVFFQHPSLYKLSLFPM